MHQMLKEALSFLETNWHVGIAGSAEAATLLRINANTFKTRLARGQALVMRERGGTNRAPLSFTGYHLIYNLLQDRLLRYGISSDAKTPSDEYLLQNLALWVELHILHEPHNIDSIFRFVKMDDGAVQSLTYENGAVLEYTGDAALIVPIGTMTVRVATQLFAKACPARISDLVRQK